MTYLRECSRRAGLCVSLWMPSYVSRGLAGAIALFVHTDSVVAQAAPSCDVSVTSLNFGAIDMTANASVDGAASMSVTCTSAGNIPTMRVCISLGWGSAGNDGAGRLRVLESGGANLGYNLYKDPARTSPWGSFGDGSMGTTGLEVIVPATSSGSSSAAPITIYGRIPVGQQAAGGGIYLSDFVGADARITWGVATMFPTCESAMAETSSTAFTVSAEIIPTCNVSATVLDFGRVGILDEDVDGNAAIAVACTNGHPYNVGLNQGIGPDATITERAMAGPGGTIRYSLFRDNARSLFWGNTIGADTAAGSGTGFAQQMNVHGRIPAQTTPTPGTYSDTVTVIITY